MEIIVQLVASLAWPSTILIIVFIFRSEFTKAFSRLSNLKYKELEVKFRNELEKVEKEVKSINTKTSEIKANKSIDLTFNSEYENLIKIAELSPRAAITSAWFEIEKASKEVVKSAGIDFKRTDNVVEVVNFLIKEKYFNEEAKNVFYNLRKLRNQAVHSPEFALSMSEAERFIDVSLSLARSLYGAASLLPSVSYKAN